MIKRIVIKDIATFDSEGITIDDLQKVNFIYGGNACGKTTISRVLSCQDLAKYYPHCVVEWDGEPLQVITYNKDFRDRNLLEQIPGVFTLGQASVDAVEEIESLSVKRESFSRAIQTARANIDARSQEIEKLKNDRQELLWKNIYKKNEEFKACLKGYLYKNTFELKILDTVRNGISSPIPTVDDLRKRYQVLFAVDGTPAKIAIIPESLDIVTALSEVTDDSIWTRRIVGREDVPIAALIKKLNMADWVRHGQSLLEQSDSICPFCQKDTIDAHFRSQLESFFDDNYVRDTNRVVELRERYDILIQKLTSYYDDITTIVDSVLSDKAQRDLFVSNVRSINDFLSSNLEMMSKKEREPGAIVSFNDITPPTDSLQALIDAANDAIRAHNSMVDNLVVEREKLKNDVWQYLGSLASEEIKSIGRSIRGKENALTNHRKDETEAQNSFNTIDAEIKTKEAQVTSVQPTITRINNALLKFGFTGFSIQPSETDANKYQIKRKNGSLAHESLSEGERTFITFLYYMQLVEGSTSQSNIKSPRVLVIDDPISSRDSNVLFVVSTMIKRVLKDVRDRVAGKSQSDVKQVIILTHNVYFHKEVSFFQYNQRTAPQTNHWVVYKTNDLSIIDPCGPNNPICSSYELLWRQGRNSKENLTSTDNITLQNVMRRIIENYFKIFGGKKDIITTSFSDPEEQIIATSFASWYDEGSHDLSDDLFVQNPQIANEKYLHVFEMLFKGLGHESHYNMMMHIEDNRDAQE